MFFAVAGLIPAANTYGPVNISSSTASLTISQSQHGFTSNNLGVAVFSAPNGGGSLLGQAAYSYSIDGSLNVNITFSPSISSGSVYVNGQFDSNTASSTDFQVSTGTYFDGSNYDPALVVCAVCSSSSIAVRTYNGASYALQTPYYVYMTDLNPRDVLAYIKDNVMTFGISSSSASGVGCYPTSSCAVVPNIAAYPAGSISLAHSSYQSTGILTTVTDDRPAAFQ
jgi:hypothetical protein